MTTKADVRIFSSLTASYDQWSQAIYYLKTLLVSQCGWTVSGSFTTTGGVDGVDRIVAATTISTAGLAHSGVIVRSPDAKVEILLAIGSAGVGNGYVGFNACNADATKYYAGTWSSGSIPTSTTAVATYNGNLNFGSSFASLHMTAESASPYGFAFVQTDRGSSGVAQRWAIGLLPLEQTPTGLLVPYAQFSYVSSSGGGFLSGSANMGAEGGFNGANPRTAVRAAGDTLPTTCSSWLQTYDANSSLKTYPGGVGYDNGDAVEPMCPISIGKIGGRMHGVTKYAQWKGINRTHLDMLGGDKSKIVFGDCIFPWDPTVPSIP